MFGKIIKSTTAKLNDVNDVLAGENTAGGTGQSQYIGQYGLVAELGPDTVKYDSAIGTLFGGWYMYVKVLATSVIAPARGGLAFWVVPTGSILEDTFTVTGDATPAAARPGLVAGVFINAITPGNSGFIQIAGRASVLFDSAVTASAAGNWVSAKISAATTTSGYPADVGAAVNPQTIAADLGIAETAPTVSVISVVQLKPRYLRV